MRSVIKPENAGIGKFNGILCIDGPISLHKLVHPALGTVGFPGKPGDRGD